MNKSKLHILSSVKIEKDLSDSVEIKDYPKNKKILLVSPHSDDVSVSCGGTITAIASFNKIIPVLFFAGYRGIEEKDKEEATRIREKEMEKESEILNIEKPIFLRLSSYADKDFLLHREDVLKVEKVLITEKPDIIFLPKRNDLHPRHKLATSILMGALKKVKEQKEIEKLPDLFFSENPWSLFDAFEFNVVSIFSEKEMSNKIKAIQAHPSQIKRTLFDAAAKTLAEFRGAVVPEQRIFGYGKDGRKRKGLDKIYIEAFNHENNNLWK